MHRPPAQWRHGSPTTGPQSKFDSQRLARSGEQVRPPPPTQTHSQVWLKPLRHRGATQGFPASWQSASLLHEGGATSVVEVVVVIVVVVGMGQAMRRGCGRHRRTNFVGLAPSAVTSVIFCRSSTDTGKMRSKQATSPHTLMANVQTALHCASASQRIGRLQPTGHEVRGEGTPSRQVR